MPTESFEADNSACQSSDCANLSSSCDNLTSISQQSSVLSDMRCGNSTAALYLPDCHIDGLDNATAFSSSSASATNVADSALAGSNNAAATVPKDNGAIADARQYWQNYSDDAVKEGGLSGFANYVVGNTMGLITEGVQAAKDARDDWGNLAQTSDSEVARVLAGMAHDVLVPAAVLDHMGASLDDVAGVDQKQVADGLQKGVLKLGYRDAQDVMDTVNWLDKQIPRDGKPQTEDRRTALLVSLASAQAGKESNDPKLQEELAYDRLFALRAGLSDPRIKEQLPADMKGRELDPDIAAAEHFFEVSKRVACDSMDMYIPFAGETKVPTNAYVSAPVWATITTGYGIAKSTGLLGGSTAGEHQSSWEMAGIMRGLEINRRGH